MIKPFRQCDRWLSEQRAIPFWFRRWLQDQLKAFHSRINGMSRRRAEALTGTLTNIVIGRMVEEEDRITHLDIDVSLQELILANRLIGELGTSIQPDGSTSIHTKTEDRGIAAFYAERHFGGIHNLIKALGYNLVDGDE